MRKEIAMGKREHFCYYSGEELLSREREKK
jgi:hypothetical protein